MSCTVDTILGKDTKKAQDDVSTVKDMSMATVSRPFEAMPRC